MILIATKRAPLYVSLSARGRFTLLSIDTLYPARATQLSLTRDLACGRFCSDLPGKYRLFPQDGILRVGRNELARHSVLTLTADQTAYVHEPLLAKVEM
jgi:hypothetical protein